MNDSKSLLPYPSQLVGSYVYADRLTARCQYNAISTALLYRNVQCGGGAFTVSNAQGTNEPTIVRTKFPGVVSITAHCISADGADLNFIIYVKQPGDSAPRAVSAVFLTLKAASAVRGGTTIVLPLPAGTEIVVDGGGVRTALDEDASQMYLSVTYLAETNLRTQVRYGA